MKRKEKKEIKAILCDRYSYWLVLATNGRKTWEVGTMMKHKGETEAQAMPIALKLIGETEEEKNEIQSLS